MATGKTKDDKKKAADKKAKPSSSTKAGAKSTAKPAAKDKKAPPPAKAAPKAASLSKNDPIKQAKALIGPLRGMGGGLTSLAPSLAGSSGKLPPRLQALIDRQEIGDLFTTWCRASDRLDESLLRSVYHHDGSEDHGPGVFQGPSAGFISWWIGVLGGLKSSWHMLGPTRFDLRGDVTMTETPFLAQYRLEKATGKEDLIIGGRFLDRCERRPGGASGVWKIAHRKMVNDWVRTSPTSDIFYLQNPDALWQTRGRTDLSYNMDSFPTGQGSRTFSLFGRRYDSKSLKF
ncbi:MAG: nuclear transport factor 2 family protein [Alphaproteobacteria bacterium]|nr:MAG: nuclear transport factor 2 family protein [Alphaproteobacteria bacterium]